MVDKEGVKYADPITYVTLILGIPGIVAVAFVVARGGIGRLREAFDWRSALGGVFSIAAYALVLIALTMAPAASVAAVREVERRDRRVSWRSRPPGAGRT